MVAITCCCVKAPNYCHPFFPEIPFSVDTQWEPRSYLNFSVFFCLFNICCRLVSLFDWLLRFFVFALCDSDWSYWFCIGCVWCSDSHLDLLTPVFVSGIRIGLKFFWSNQRCWFRLVTPRGSVVRDCSTLVWSACVCHLLEVLTLRNYPWGVWQ